MDEMKRQEVEEQQSDATSAGKEGKQERLFTQDELNKIIAERLARERDKTSGGSEAVESRENELTEREAALNEREEALEARFQQLNELEAQVAEKRAELDAAQLRTEKLWYLTDQLHIKAEVASTLIDFLGGDTLPEFKDIAKTVVSALGPEIVADSTRLIPPQTADTVLREAFGLQKG